MSLLPVVPCKYCTKPTTMTATKLCDSCWELESRIQRNPPLAAKILAILLQEQADELKKRSEDAS